MCGEDNSVLFLLGSFNFYSLQVRKARGDDEFAQPVIISLMSIGGKAHRR